MTQWHSIDGLTASCVTASFSQLHSVTQLYVAIELAIAILPRWDFLYLLTDLEVCHHNIAIATAMCIQSTECVHICTCVASSFKALWKAIVKQTSSIVVAMLSWLWLQLNYYWNTYTYIHTHIQTHKSPYSITSLLIQHHDIIIM